MASIMLRMRFAQPGTGGANRPLGTGWDARLRKYPS
jgi:hypothetical protein